MDMLSTTAASLSCISVRSRRSVSTVPPPIPTVTVVEHNFNKDAVDAAGNGEKISDSELPANAEAIKDFYVTTNLWVRYYTNQPLFFGSIAGVIILTEFDFNI